MMRKLTGKGERVREKMIETTVHILQQQGFKKATVRSIAKAAGVNIASVRYYFGSKEELIGAALEYMMGNLENIVSYLDDKRLTASERLKKYIIAYFHLAREHPALFRSWESVYSPQTLPLFLQRGYFRIHKDKSWPHIPADFRLQNSPFHPDRF